MSEVSVDTVAEAMYEMTMVQEDKLPVQVLDLSKAMIEKYGVDAIDKKFCKKAIRQLIDSGRCTYSYVGGSYIVLPPDSPDAK